MRVNRKKTAILQSKDSEALKTLTSLNSPTLKHNQVAITTAAVSTRLV